MPIDFYKAPCQKNIITTKFGISDDDNDLPAYLDSVDESIWIATVHNDDAKTVTFTAIDHCIDFPLIDGKMPSRCDAMLTCENCLYLIELKNKRADWQSSGIEQLEATIQDLISEIGETYFSYRKRKAYVANKRHPNFHVIENETMEKFRDKYLIRLDIQANIKII